RPGGPPGGAPLRAGPVLVPGGRQPGRRTGTRGRAARRCRRGRGAAPVRRRLTFVPISQLTKASAADAVPRRVPGGFGSVRPNAENTNCPFCHDNCAGGRGPYRATRR